MLSLSKQEDRAAATVERTAPFDRLRTRYEFCEVCGGLSTNVVSGYPGWQRAPRRAIPDWPMTFLVLSLSKGEDSAIFAARATVILRQAQDEDG
jgi:hypothetical protein